jgi:hypothetical protein
MNESKTLLERRIKEGDESLAERTKYSVIRNRLVAMGGTSSNDIYAEKFEKGDFLILNYRNYDDDKVPLEIVNNRHSEKTVLKKLYENALEVAIQVAERDGNDLMDLTGHVPIPKNAKYYIDRGEKIPSN